MLRRTGAAALAAILTAAASATIGADQEPGQTQAPRAVWMAPEAVDIAAGPYIADPAVVSLLDRSDPGGDCARSGPLVFGCLIQALSASQAHEAPIGALANPFNLNVAQDIRETIEQDLVGFQNSGGIEPSQVMKATENRMPSRSGASAMAPYMGGGREGFVTGQTRLRSTCGVPLIRSR